MHCARSCDARCDECEAYSNPGPNMNRNCAGTVGNMVYRQALPSAVLRQDCTRMVLAIHWKWPRSPGTGPVHFQHNDGAKCHGRRSDSVHS